MASVHKYGFRIPISSEQYPSWLLNFPVTAGLDSSDATLSKTKDSCQIQHSQMWWTRVLVRRWYLASITIAIPIHTRHQGSYRAPDGWSQWVQTDYKTNPRQKFRSGFVGQTIEIWKIFIYCSCFKVKICLVFALNSFTHMLSSRIRENNLKRTYFYFLWRHAALCCTMREMDKT